MCDWIERLVIPSEKSGGPVQASVDFEEKIVRWTQVDQLGKRGLKGRWHDKPIRIANRS